MKKNNKEILKILAFVLPYIVVEFTNTLLVIIDKSISNSIGKTAIIVFSSFVTLNWTINTIQTCMSKAHSIVSVRDRKNKHDINTTGIMLELIVSTIISILVFLFAKQITHIYNLENDAREILFTILKMKAIELPIVSIGYIAKNELKIQGKTKNIFIITIIAAIFNIGGDCLSVKFGYNEIGIYVATIVSTIIETTLLFIESKVKIRRVKKHYIKEIIKYSKDLIFDKIIQRIINITYTRIASSFGTNIFAIHCACLTVIETLSEIQNGYYSGLLVKYAEIIEEDKKNIIKKVDSIEMYSIFSIIILDIIFLYPMWYIMGKAVPWNECNPYIWFYSLELITTVASSNYMAYVSANKDTKAIRNAALIGGICVRMPLMFIIKYFNLGLIGLSFVVGIDKLVRITYLRLHIRRTNIYKNVDL